MNEQGREQFERERQFLNDLVMKYSSKTTKRFFSLDGSGLRKQCAG